MDEDGAGTVNSAETEYYVYDSDDLATTAYLLDHTTSDDGAVPLGADADLDAGQIVLQLDESGAPTHRYLWGPAVDQILADETVDATPGTADDVHWLLTDHQNAVRDLVVKDGTEWTVENHITYDAFGNEISHTGAVDSLFGWTGRMHDERTGLNNNGNRWYDPLTARWQSEDPIAFAGDLGNLYRYCGNDPVNWIDPSGLVRGHHKIPEELWKWIEINRDVATEVWDAEDARVFPPRDDVGYSTGHNRTAHGLYTEQVRGVLTDELIAYRKQHGIKGPFTIAQQRDFAKRVLSKIDSMPEDSFIGGFNRAVARGGTKAVTEWRDAFGRRAVEKAREVATQKCGKGIKTAPMGKMIKGLGILAVLAGPATVAANMVGEPEHVRVAKIEFLQQYRVAMSIANRTGQLPGNVRINLYKSFIAYSDALGADTSGIQWVWGHYEHLE